MRIAGVNVGKVTEVELAPDGEAANVTFTIDEEGLPLHDDARITIRPRLFLEGNFFVDLKPGTPDSPQLDSGDTIAITQTSTPVQLDQVLTALQSDSREDLTAVQAVIWVESESQKGILIGKGGAMIRDIGTAARAEIEGLLGRRVFLDLKVRVRRGWRRDEDLLDRLGIEG